jgi:hypothetical protein
VFFEYRQNNSGGGYDYDASRGIGHDVIIEAADSDEANYRAERIGLYFDGADEGGPDCDCCGDRWYRAWSREGDAQPSHYGEPLATEYVLSLRKNGPTVFVHYDDGRIEGYESR